MAIKWVKDEVVDSIQRGRKSVGNTKAVEEIYPELRQNPNKWAELPIKVTSHSSARQWAKKFKGLEIKMTGGNNYAKNHPKKKDWTIYLRFVSKDGAAKRPYNKTGKYSKTAK